MKRGCGNAGLCGGGGGQPAAPPFVCDSAEWEGAALVSEVPSRRRMSYFVSD